MFEAKALLVIALPLIFAYLADVLMVITAKMVVGRLGALELAAAEGKNATSRIRPMLSRVPPPHPSIAAAMRSRTRSTVGVLRR
jgi:hypothetical protein